MQKYLIPQAKNTRTKQLVQEQDLSGRRFTQDQRAECRMVAESLAQRMMTRSPDQWVAVIKEYTA